MDQPCVIFLRAGLLKAAFEHHTGRRGADRCFEEGRVDVHSALVRHTRTHLQPETNGNTPQSIVRTRDFECLYSPCGADDRAARRTVATISVEGGRKSMEKLTQFGHKESLKCAPAARYCLELSMHTCCRPVQR